VLGVLSRKPKDARETLRSDLLEPDETYAGHSVAGLQLRPKRRRQLPLDDRRISAEVDEKAPTYEPVNLGNAHAGNAATAALRDMVSAGVSM